MKNILIACISLLDRNNDSRQPIEYSSDSITLSAKQTNEACAKFLLKKLARDGKILDTYIRIQSNYVEQDDHTMKYLDDNIDKFCNMDNLTPPQNLDLFLREDEKNRRYDRVLKEISDKILNIADNDPQISIYLDMAGGKRDNYVFIQLLTKLLSFYGFEVHSYYADIDGEIVNTDLSFRHMEILDAVNEFVHTGSVALLRQCYDTSQNRSVKKLLDAMDDFSASIQLCSTDITDTYDRLEKRLENVDKTLANNSGDLFMIKAMIPLIKKKFGFETNGSNFIKGDNPERNTLKIIKWCLEHNLIQQALTIYSEKITQIIFNKKFIEIDTDIHSVPLRESKYKPGSDELFYILKSVFKNLKDVSPHPIEFDDELFIYKQHPNGNANWEQMLASFFFEEDCISKGIKLNINEQLFKKILCDTRFASCARNRVNHASDRNSYDEEIIELFRKYTPSYSSYKDANAFKPDNIKKDLSSAVESLEKALDLVEKAYLTV